MLFFIFSIFSIGIVQSTIPLNYSFYEEFPHCQNPVWDVGRCGGATIEVLAAESTSLLFCRESGEKINLSPQDALSCDHEAYGCNGATLEAVWDYMEKEGVVENSCFPYSSGSGQVPPCVNKCIDGKNWTESKHYIKSYGAVTGGEENILQHLYSSGPLGIIHEVTSEFFSYKGGIFHCSFEKHQSEKPVNPALVSMIIGYGETANGDKYYVAQNSWGSSWGNNGMYLIGRGSCWMDGYWYSEI